MKISEYNQMMKYLTRKKDPKPKVRQETMPERIDRVIYQYDSPAGMKKPKHIDNKNIKTFEEMQTVNKVIDYSPNKTKRPVYKGMELWEEKKKTKVEPIKIDIEGISNSLTKYIETMKPTEEILNTPDPKRPVPKEVELEGIETILGIKA